MISDSGGPAGFVYGFLFVWVGTLATYASLGELASMLCMRESCYGFADDMGRAPTAGGQYHWVSMLAPPSSQKFLSYMTGGLSADRLLSNPD